MKHLSIAAKLAAAGLTVLTLTGSVGTAAEAASLADIKNQLKDKGYAVAAIDCSEDVTGILKELCQEFANGNLTDCPIISLPGNCKPNVPAQPETGTPETNQPETNTPEVSTPETSEPETDVPETNQPGTSKPETGTPETNQPGTGKPETSAPETNQPETNTPETNQPSTGTNQPETNTPGTSTENLSFAEQVVKLVNEERTKAGLSEVTLDKNIEAAALTRAKEIETSFSHTRPDGRSFSTVLTDNGITYRGSGENIAWGQRSPEEVMKGWMNSDGHRANILNPKFTKIGVGYYKNAAGRNYWTQLFTY